MNTLVINCGSSSISFKVYRIENGLEPVAILSGKARNVATKTLAESRIDWRLNGEPGGLKVDLPSHRLAAEKIIGVLKEKGVEINAAGHRFVHGGGFFDHTVRIDGTVMEKLRQSFNFAPIHNPNSYSAIQVCQEQYPDVPEYAVFDTSFHAATPPASSQYAIPAEIAERYGYRKYGFHGLSYQYISGRAAELIGKPLESLKLILCHLGTGGSSVTAVKYGLPLDNSMGYSPLAGLVMSTRCGDIDAEVVLSLIRGGMSVDEVSNLLNNRSGLIGLSGFSSNLDEIIAQAEKGDARCELAYEVYAHRLQLYLGAYTWILNGADAIIFTDDVGMRTWSLRQKVLTGVDGLGIQIDAKKNRNAPPDSASLVSSDGSRTQIWCVPTDEEIVILREIMAVSAPR